jgi:hypothetical protein
MIQPDRPLSLLFNSLYDRFEALLGASLPNGNVFFQKKVEAPC